MGSVLPVDFKAFLDVYGSGAVSGELAVSIRGGSSPSLERMRETHQMFTARREKTLSERRSEHVPYLFHPEPGGLIAWGYDQSGGEHFFLPCDPDPDRWKVVTMVHEEGCVTFDGRSPLSCRPSYGACSTWTGTTASTRTCWSTWSRKTSKNCSRRRDRSRMADLRTRSEGRTFGGFGHPGGNRSDRHFAGAVRFYCRSPVPPSNRPVP